MKYIECVNNKISGIISQIDKIVLFGQNVNAGSCISGLTRNLKIRPSGLFLNTPNSENSLVGIGFGLMMNGVSSIYFMKQQDFLLLGVDQLVNTYNIIRREQPRASFTIVTVVVDSGYEGPQSCFNNFSDLCSIARIKGYTVTNSVDIQHVFGQQLVSSGFRIIGVSQRLCKSDLLELDCIYSAPDCSLFQYSEGEDITIACFNFALPYGYELQKRIKEKGKTASLFSVNMVTPVKWDRLICDLNKTRNLVIIDDGKSENCSRDSFLVQTLENCTIDHKILISRDFSGYWLAPNADTLSIDYDTVINTL